MIAQTDRAARDMAQALRAPSRATTIATGIRGAPFQIMKSRSTLLALAAVSTGCQVEVEPANRGPSLAAQIQAAHARMHERFGAARRIEDAILHSDLDRAHVEARFVQRLDEPAPAPQWEPYLQSVWGAARQVELAGDVIDASKAAAELGRQCARCHEAMAVRIMFPDEPRPPDDIRLAPQMLQHRWAAVRMWEGLIGPADERWLDGAQRLTTVPLTMLAENTLPSAGTLAGDVAQVRLYANRALAQRDQDGRAMIFGDLLATCAHCHAKLRDR